jgi:hypothetical protein
MTVSAIAATEGIGSTRSTCRPHAAIRAGSSPGRRGVLCRVRLAAAFVHVNPVSHLVTAERGLLGGQAAIGQIAWVLIASAALTAVFAP